MSAFVLCLIGCKSYDPDDYGCLYARNRHEKLQHIHIYGPEPDNKYIYDIYLSCRRDTFLTMRKGEYNFSMYFDDILVYESSFHIFGRDTVRF